MPTISTALWIAGGLVFFCGLLPTALAETRRRPHPPYAGRIMLTGAIVLVASVAYRAATSLQSGDISDVIASFLDGFAIIVVGYTGVVVYARFKRERAR